MPSSSSSPPPSVVVPYSNESLIRNQLQTIQGDYDILKLKAKLIARWKEETESIVDELKQLLDDDNSTIIFLPGDSKREEFLGKVREYEEAMMEFTSDNLEYDTLLAAKIPRVEKLLTSFPEALRNGITVATTTTTAAGGGGGGGSSATSSSPPLPASKVVTLVDGTEYTMACQRDEERFAEMFLRDVQTEMTEMNGYSDSQVTNWREIYSSAKTMKQSILSVCASSPASASSASPAA